MSANKRGASPVGTNKQYEVGYAKPPKTGQFRPGISGNPKGRPRRKAMTEDNPSASRDSFNEIIMEEAYRPITIQEGGKTTQTPIIRAVFRTISLQAIKGDRRSQKMLVDLITNVDSERKVERDKLVEAAIEYKFGWERELERCKKLGIKEPDLVPHPDDIHIDFANNSIEITGPWTKEEKDIFDKIKAIKREEDETISRLHRRLSHEPSNLEIQQQLQEAIEARERSKWIIENTGIKFTD